jgi:hypothetical protein
MNMSINPVDVDNGRTGKMRVQILKRIYSALTDLDSEIDNGDTEPAFAGAVALVDRDKGILRVKVGERRFDITVQPSFR